MNILIKIVYFIKLNHYYKMSAENFFLRSHFNSTMEHMNEMLSIALAFQENVSIMFVHCNIIFIMLVHLRQQHVLDDAFTTICCNQNRLYFDSFPPLLQVCLALCRYLSFSPLFYFGFFSRFFVCAL